MITLTDYTNNIVKDFTKVLEDDGFANGDIIKRSDYSDSKTYFFRDFNEKEDFQKKTYIVWEHLSANVAVYNDNKFNGGYERVGLVIVTPDSLRSKQVLALSNRVEKAFENTDWQVNGITSDRDWSTGLNTITFSLGKVFSR